MRKTFRKISAIVLAFAMVFSTVPSFAVGDAAQEQHVVIAHTTDTHGYADADNSSFGYAKLAAFMNKVRKENKNTLILDSGDMYEGMAFSNIEKGESVVPIVKAIGYDAMTTGNHEYSYGLDTLKKLTDAAGVPVLAANVKDEAGNLVFQDSIVKDFNGFKVGIFGLANEETPSKTIPAGTEGLVFKKCEETAKDMVKKLKAEGAEYIIALTHIGSAESEGSASVALAKANTGIDLILDGHSHVVNKGTAYGTTTLVASGYYTKNIGMIDLTVENDIVKKVDVKMVTPDQEPNLQADPTVDKIVKTYQAKQAILFDTVIGKMNSFWNGEKAVVRGRESNLGRLIAESYLEKSNADVAFVNGGGVRMSIEPGDVTVGDIYNTQPFGNYLITKEVTGAQLKQIMEAALNQNSGEFLQIAGMQVSYDSSKPAGSKVVSISMADKTKKFDANAKYVVVASNYVATHAVFPALRDAKEINQFGSDYEATVAYIQKNGMKTLDPALVNVNKGETLEIIRKSWPIEKTATYADPKMIQDGTWLLPLRAILENDGYAVSYDSKTKIATVKKEDLATIQVNVQNGTVKTNGKEFQFETQSVDGRTLIAQGFFEMVLPCKVYDHTKETQSIILY